MCLSFPSECFTALSLIFTSLTMIYLGMIFLMIDVFYQFSKILSYCCSIFFPIVSPLLLYHHLHYVRWLYIVPQVTEALLIFISIFFLCSSVWKISLELSSKSLALFSLVSNLLLSLSQGSFISDIVFFSLVFPLVLFYSFYILTEIPHRLLHIYSCFLSHP